MGKRGRRSGILTTSSSPIRIHWLLRHIDPNWEDRQARPPPRVVNTQLKRQQKRRRRRQTSFCRKDSFRSRLHPPSKLQINKLPVIQRLLTQFKVLTITKPRTSRSQRSLRQQMTSLRVSLPDPHQRRLSSALTGRPGTQTQPTSTAFG